MNKETQIFEEPQNPKLGISVVCATFFVTSILPTLKKRYGKEVKRETWGAVY